MVSLEHTGVELGGRARLRELVERFQVCWCTSRENAVIDGEVRPIGFNIELSAVHDHPERPPTPGCPECEPVLAALREIVEFVLPKDARDSRYEVHLKRLGLEFSGAHRDRPEVVALIQVLHKRGVNDPIDACEVRCLNEMTKALADLGACEGRWARRPS